MTKKPEINLNLVPQGGEIFSFDSGALKEISVLEKVVAFSSENRVKFFILPIDTDHYQIEIDLKLLQPQSCSRCGEEFEKFSGVKKTEYFSARLKDEGEDQGFILVESPKKWNWAEFVVETLELEAPYLIYKYGEKCLVSCKHYDEAVEKGWITEEKKPASPFKALEKLKLN